MKKHFTIKKRKNQRNKRKNQRSTLRKRFSKTMRKHKRNNKTVYIRNKTKRLRKKHIFSRIYKGGDAQYPAVYGIDNKSNNSTILLIFSLEILIVFFSICFLYFNNS